MIKIEINAESGSEARGALLELLGLTGQSQVITNIASPGMIIIDDPKPEVTTEQAKEFIVETIKKRRTKAEIEAERLAAENTNAIPDGGDNAPEQQNTVVKETAQETTDATTVTVDDLKKKAVELGRVGKRELCRAVLQKFDAESISTPDKTPLKPEHYAAVLDEFNKL